MNELDILEMRLNVLDPFVDHFVLCEARETFSGIPKRPFYFDNRKRFEKWREKIIRIVPPNLKTNDSFERAGFQKDFMRQSIRYLNHNDIVYFGDVDEIWKPQEVGDEVYNLRQLNYSYFLNNRSSEEWIGTVVGKWGKIKNQSFNHWRAHHDNILPDGGWHFSNMGGIEQIKKKLESYDHQEFNTDEVKALLADRMKFGEDYVGRTLDWQGKPFSFHIDDSELPEYIKSNKAKYVHLFR